MSIPVEKYAGSDTTQRDADSKKIYSTVLEVVEGKQKHWSALLGSVKMLSCQQLNWWFDPEKERIF